MNQPKNHNFFRTAFKGMVAQAKAHGVDTSDPKVMGFIQSQAEVMAQDMARRVELEKKLGSWG